jgi:hypothetical protein
VSRLYSAFYDQYMFLASKVVVTKVLGTAVKLGLERVTSGKYNGSIY